MTMIKSLSLAAAILTVSMGYEARAFPGTGHAGAAVRQEVGGSFVETVQWRGLIELFDDDDYVHDRHYDWEQYRNSTSRKERIRDYYRMQKDVQKDYWRQQKEMQKQMIKRQRGW